MISVVGFSAEEGIGGRGEKKRGNRRKKDKR